MMKAKRLCAILLCGAMVVSIAGCQKQNVEQYSESLSSEQNNEQNNVSQSAEETADSEAMFYYDMGGETYTEDELREMLPVFLPEVKNIANIIYNMDLQTPDYSGAIDPLYIENTNYPNQAYDIYKTFYDLNMVSEMKNYSPIRVVSVSDDKYVQITISGIVEAHAHSDLFEEDDYNMILTIGFAKTLSGEDDWEIAFIDCGFIYRKTDDFRMYIDEKRKSLRMHGEQVAYIEHDNPEYLETVERPFATD